MAPSVIRQAKRSVDHTVDAYLGRAAFSVCVLAAAIFALVGIWIVLVENYGTIIACFGLAAILLVASLIIRATVVAAERAAEKDIREVESSIGESVGAFPFDISTAVALLPAVLPLLRSVRIILPFVLIGALVASYFSSSPKSSDPNPAPEATA